MRHHITQSGREAILSSMWKYPLIYGVWLASQSLAGTWVKASWTLLGQL